MISANIVRIHELEFALRVVETKSYSPLFTTDLISIDTSAEPEVHVYDELGQIAYDKNNVKIIFQTPFSDRTTSDASRSPVYEFDGNTMMLVYLYNGTDRSIAVQTGDVIVNGYDMTSVMNRSVLPDKRAVDAVTLYAQDLDEHSIDEIDICVTSDLPSGKTGNFSFIPQEKMTYKQYCGDFFTASAFGLFVCSELIRTGKAKKILLAEESRGTYSFTLIGGLCTN